MKKKQHPEIHTHENQSQGSSDVCGDNGITVKGKGPWPRAMSWSCTPSDGTRIRSAAAASSTPSDGTWFPSTASCQDMSALPGNSERPGSLSATLRPAPTIADCSDSNDDASLTKKTNHKSIYKSIYYKQSTKYNNSWKRCVLIVKFSHSKNQKINMFERLALFLTVSVSVLSHCCWVVAVVAVVTLLFLCCVMVVSTVNP